MNSMKGSYTEREREFLTCGNTLADRPQGIAKSAMAEVEQAQKIKVKLWMLKFMRDDIPGIRENSDCRFLTSKLRAFTKNRVKKMIHKKTGSLNHVFIVDLVDTNRLTVTRLWPRQRERQNSVKKGCASTARVSCTGWLSVVLPEVVRNVGESITRQSVIKNPNRCCWPPLKQWRIQS